MDQLHKEELIQMVRFYGSVVSTNGLNEDTKKQANKNVDRLLAVLAPEVDRAIAEASGLTLL